MIIVAAGGAAHLAGVVAAVTTLPVDRRADGDDVAEWNGLAAFNRANAGGNSRGVNGNRQSRAQSIRRFSPLKFWEHLMRKWRSDCCTQRGIGEVGGGKKCARSAAVCGEEIVITFSDEARAKLARWNRASRQALSELPAGGMIQSKRSPS